MTGLIRPLHVIQQDIETVKSGITSCDGYLISSTKSRGIILCDASRGSWKTFLCRTWTRREDVTLGDRNLANLQTAQWLDHAKKHVARG
jgi:hypothetical protein